MSFKLTLMFDNFDELIKNINDIDKFKRKDEKNAIK